MEKGIPLITELLNEIMWPGQQTTVLLETMAGKGTEVGGRLKNCAVSWTESGCPEKMGVCLDTCHVYDAGYDIVHHLDEVLEEFDRIIGREKLKAVHINDSKNPFGSHKDRHEKIGEGQYRPGSLCQDRQSSCAVSSALLSGRRPMSWRGMPRRLLC